MAQVQELSFFNPLSVPGCQLWLDAADTSTITLSGTSVTQWNDKSGNANNATSPTVNRPLFSANSLNNQGTLTFRSNSDVLLVSNNNFTTTSFPSLCYLIVISPAATQPNNTNAGILSTDTAAAYGRSLAFGAGNWQEERYSAFTNITPYTANVWTIVSLQFSTTVSATLAVNGTTFAGVASGTGTNTTGLKIGSYNNTSSYATYNANFDTAEILVYGANLTTLERQQLEGYLAWKWGLQGNLPLNHPFKLFPPIGALDVGTTLPPFQIINTPVFLPTQISGCQLWLDGTDINGNGMNPANGSTVSTWVDKSGLGNSATAVGTITFQNNSMVYNTANGTYFVGNTSNTTNSLTLFTVCLVNNVTTGRWLFTGSPANNTQVFNLVTGFAVATAGATTTFRAFRNNTALSLQTMPLGSSFINSQLFNGVNNTNFLNGSAATSVASTGNFNLLVYNVGSSTGEQQNVSFNGRFQEVILYPFALTTSQRQQVEGYLAWKWGLISSLPLTHPYRISPIAPFPFTTTARQAFLNSWLPTQVSGCQMWFDAADPASIILSGTNVTQWNDKSGNNRNASQSTASNQPTYTTSNIVFDGTNSYFSIPTAAIRPTNIFAVVQTNTVSTGARHIFRKGRNPGTNFEFTIRTSNADVVSIWGYGTGASLLTLTGTGSATTSRQILSALWNGTTANMYVNAKNVDTANLSGTQFVATTTFRIGASFTTDSDASAPALVWDGTMQEIIVYNLTPTTDQRQQIEGYLAWKWGLQGNLPATHPFKLFPPSP